MVKWDEGSSTGLVEQHLTRVGEGIDNLANGGDETSGLSEHLTRDAESTDDREDNIEAETHTGGVNARPCCGDYRHRGYSAVWRASMEESKIHQRRSTGRTSRI